MEFAEFITFIPDDADVRPLVADEVRRYIRLNPKTNETHLSPEGFVLKEAMSKAGYDKRTTNRSNAGKGLSDGDTISDPYKNIVDGWKKADVSKRGDPFLAHAVFYWFFRFESEPSYFIEIAKKVWNVNSSDFKRFYYAKKGGLPDDSFDAIIKRFKTPNAVEEYATICVLDELLVPEITAISASNKPTNPKSPPLVFPQEITDDEAWLNANNFTAIPLVNRDNELDLLDRFLNSNDPFSILPIIAPSGAGKTRLVTEWMHKRVDLDKWAAGFLQNRTSKSWEEWQPAKNTLIIIDYVFQFDEAIRAIMNAAIHQKHHHIRLVVIDHIFPNSLRNIIDDPFWQAFAEDRSELDDRKDLFYSGGPLRLDKQNRDKKILSDIISAVSHCSTDSKEFSEALEYLRTMGDAAQYPLFAILVGYALKNGKDLFSLNRRELIEYYINKKSRLSWKVEKTEQDAQWAGRHGEWPGTFIAAATARRGLPFESLADCLPDSYNQRQSNFNELVHYCNRIVSSQDGRKLVPFEPDIIGQTYFLLYWQEFRKVTETRHAFIAMLEGAFDDPIQCRVAFVSFFKKLISNLLDEERTDTISTGLWQSLESFLHPKHFKKHHPLRHAMTEILAAAASWLQNLHEESRAKVLIKRAEILAISELSFLDVVSAANAVDHYFYACGYLNNNSGESEKVAVEVFDRFEEYFEGKIPRLVYAASVGNWRLVAFFLTKGDCDINCHSVNGETPLIAASERDQVAVVTMLILLKSCDPNRYIADGSTALIAASKKGYARVVARLLTRDDINVSGESFEGRTAIDYARINGHDKIVRLIEKHVAAQDLGDENFLSQMDKLMAEQKSESE